MADAVRLALEHNHQLRAQRLGRRPFKGRRNHRGPETQSRPDVNERELSDLFAEPAVLVGQLPEQPELRRVPELSLRARRQAGEPHAGGSRHHDHRIPRHRVRGTTAGVQTRQAFLGILLAKSTLDLARENLNNFTNVVDVNRARVNAGDLAEADFYKILLQKLQFEQDVSSSEVALVQAKAALRQSVGFEAIAEEFDVDGDLAFTKYVVTLERSQTGRAGTAPPICSGPRAGSSSPKTTRRSRSATGLATSSAASKCDRASSLNALGFQLLRRLALPRQEPGEHRPQQDRGAAGVRVRRPSDEHRPDGRRERLRGISDEPRKVISLYQSGYLDQAKESLDITTYVYQNGSGTLFDLLDAERTYRATQLAFRQALAAYMTAVQQVNFVVGRQVMQ